ncbi:MAG: KPN_02809 family neutral zinc metallopeptidase [Thermoleophilaceae bacterium]
MCAVVIAACGSSSSKSPTTGASTTEAGAIAGNVLVRLPTVPEPSGAPPTLSGSSDLDQRAYLTKVFDDTQALWQRQFAAASQPYRPAKLVLFSQAIQATGCGAQADVGPFYCPADHGIYLDLNFFQLLVQRFGIGGFAQAYIVGHEFGHHVQTLLGISNRVAAANRADPSGERARSVRVEVQADCLAGVWAHSVYTRGQLTDEDLNQALSTAAVIGDDFQQRMAGHRVDSTLWTHGSSAQRQHWLKAGFVSGEPGSCDTFSQPTP